MSGGNSITYYAPQILQSIGLNSAQILLFTSIYGCVKVCSVLLYAFVLTDRFGRRPLLLIGSTMNVLCLLYLSVFLGVAKIDATAKPTPAAWIAIVAICIFAIGYGFGWAPGKFRNHVNFYKHPITKLQSFPSPHLKSAPLVLEAPLLPLLLPIKMSSTLLSHDFSRI